MQPHSTQSKTSRGVTKPSEPFYDAILLTTFSRLVRDVFWGGFGFAAMREIGNGVLTLNRALTVLRKDLGKPEAYSFIFFERLVVCFFFRGFEVRFFDPVSAVDG